MQNIECFRRCLYEPPEDGIIEPGEDREQLPLHWNYMLYRTYYGPGSNEQWSKLLDKITYGVEKGLAVLKKEANLESEVIARIQNQF